MTKEIKNVRIKFRRDNEAAYSSSLALLKGEICLVDTNEGLKFKVGDGTSTYGQLPFVGEDNLLKNSVIQGYFNQGSFYTTSSFTTKIEGQTNKVYIDISTGKIYFYNNSFVQCEGHLPGATATRPGVLKLYNTYGSNTDGVVTQKFFTEALDGVVLAIDENDPTCLVLEKLW